PHDLLSYRYYSGGRRSVLDAPLERGALDRAAAGGLGGVAGRADQAAIARVHGVAARALRRAALAGSLERAGSDARIGPVSFADGIAAAEVPLRRRRGIGPARGEQEDGEEQSA